MRCHGWSVSSSERARCLTDRSRSFAAGSLPLTLNLSPRSLKLLTALGTGVLVGTALIVIIPEGVETLYSANGSSHRHDKRALEVRGQAVQWLQVRGLDIPAIREAALPASDLSITADRDPLDVSSNINTGPGTGKPSFSGTTAQHAGIHTNEDEEDDDDKHDDKDGKDPHAYVGLSIIVGFILMYLIDNLPKYITPSSQPRRFQINLNSLSFNRASATAEGEDGESNTLSAQDEAKASSTTVGLVIHAAADGIALGASSTSTWCRSCPQC